jgi:hypothetical protein
VIQLLRLDGEDELGTRLEVERDRALLLELGVDAYGLLEVRLDPARRLAEDEASVPAGGSCSDPSPLDEDDAVAALGEEPRDREAGDSAADDDGAARQLSVASDSPSSDFLRQKKSAPPTAAAVPATTAVDFRATRDLELFVSGTAAFAFRVTNCLTIGFAAL